MTSLQRRNIEIYLRFRERPMSISGLFWANRRMYLMLLIGFAGIAALMYSVGGAAGASYVLVVLAAILLRDIGFYRRSVSIWPVLREVFDWKKIEELASSKIDPLA